MRRRASDPTRPPAMEPFAPAVAFAEELELESVPPWPTAPRSPPAPAKWPGVVVSVGGVRWRRSRTRWRGRPRPRLVPARAPTNISSAAGDLRIGQVDVLDHAAGADEAEQAGIAVGGEADRADLRHDRGVIDEQVRDCVPGPVQGPGEGRRTVAADGHEAAHGVPDARGARGLAGVDIVGQRVVGGRDQRHQLKLVSIGDGGGIFRPQDRTGLAGDQEPGVGEVPSDVACRRIGADAGRSADPDDVGRRSGAPQVIADGLVGRSLIPEAVRQEAGRRVR